MKPKQIVNSTTNSRVYKMTRYQFISPCPICSPHKGCNRMGLRKTPKSWKSQRKTKYRIR